jgi:ankyrin repeat protein
MVSKLLAAGTTANASRWDGATALMIAANSGSVAAVEQLLAHGADVNATETPRGQN